MNIVHFMHILPLLFTHFFIKLTKHIINYEEKTLILQTESN